MRLFLLNAVILLIIMHGFHFSSFAQEETDAIIAEYQSLPPGNVARKSDALHKLENLRTETVDRFIYLVMEKEEDPTLRAQAFLIWANRKTPEEIITYLDSKASQSVFEALIPAIPHVIGIDRLGYLKSLYTKPGVKRFLPILCKAIATSGGEEAFLFLKRKWAGCYTHEEAMALLSALLSMKEGTDPDFLEQIRASAFPEARIEGARLLLLAKGNEVLDEIGARLKTEDHSEVHSSVLKAMALVNTEKAVLAILESASSYPHGSYHEIVEALSGVPLDLLRQAVPDDWYLDEDPVRYEVLALSFTLASAFSGTLSSKEMRLLKRGCTHKLQEVSLISSAAMLRVADHQGGSAQRIRSILCSGPFDDQWEALDTVQRYRLRDEAVVLPILNIMRGKDWKESLWNATAEFLRPFASEEILAKALMDLRSNENQKIYSSQDMVGEQAKDMIGHIWSKALEPGTISSLRRIQTAIAGTNPNIKVDTEVFALVTGQ
ncbi:MAG: hypothetical protein ABIK28_19535, partial [Planctomycetota bacterium]